MTARIIYSFSRQWLARDVGALAAQLLPKDGLFASYNHITER
jgi:hypothetical protein